MAAVTSIPRGLDYLTTIRSDQYIELTPDLLGPDLETFHETVTLIGAPLNPPIGNTDTIMERVEDATPGKPVATRIIAFANVSAAPVELKGKGPLAGFYDLYVTLSPSRESPGQTTYHAADDNGGTFESAAEFWPLFELRPLGGGRSIFVDTGKAKVPGFPMNIGSAGGTWSLRPPSPAAVRGFRAKPFFYQGQVVITAQRDGQTSPVIPMKFAGATIAKCAKLQAELTSPEQPGLLERIAFGTTKAFANLELPE
jgi:hypothetical protein